MSDQKWNDESFEKIQQHYTRKSSGFSLDDIINEVKGKPSSSSNESSYFEKLRTESDHKKQQIQNVVDDYKNKIREAENNKVAEESKTDVNVDIDRVIEQKSLQSKSGDLPKPSLTQVVELPEREVSLHELDKLEKEEGAPLETIAVMGEEQQEEILVKPSADTVVINTPLEEKLDTLEMTETSQTTKVLQAPRYPTKEDLKKNLPLLNGTEQSPEFLYQSQREEDHSVLRGERFSPVFLGADLQINEEQVLQSAMDVGTTFLTDAEEKTARKKKGLFSKKRKEKKRQLTEVLFMSEEEAEETEDDDAEANNVGISDDIFSAIQQKRSHVITQEKIDVAATKLSADEETVIVSTSIADEKTEYAAPTEVDTDDSAPIDTYESLDEDTALEEEYTEDISSEEWILWLRRKKHGATVRSVLTFIALLFSAFVLLGRYLPALLPQTLHFSEHSVWYISAAGVSLLFSALVNANVIWSGLCRFFRFRFSADGIAFVSFLVVAVYDLYFIFHWDLFAQVRYVTFDFLAILCIWGCALGRKITYTNLYKNHLLVNDEVQKMIISSPYADAADNDVMVEIGRGGDIMYGGQNQIVDPFAEQELYRFDNNKKQERFFAVLFCVLAVISAVLYVLKGSIAESLVLLAAGTIAVSPIFISFLTATATASICKSLRHLDTVITGVYGAERLTESAVLVARDTDFFEAQDVALHGIQIYNNGKIDDIILDMAAIYREIGGVLQQVFLGMVEHTSEMLPQVSDVRFHDPYGYTATVGSSVTAVGSLEFMNQMGISLDVCEDAHRIDGDGKHTLFFAVQNELKALFVMSYNASDAASDTIDMLEAEGVSLGLLTKDFFVNDKMIEHQFELKNNDSVSVLSFSTAQACENRIRYAKKTLPCIASLDGVRGIASALTACSKLLFCNRVNLVLKIVASVLALPMITALLLLGGTTVMLPVQILIFQAVWTIPAYLISLCNRL